MESGWNGEEGREGPGGCKDSSCFCCPVLALPPELGDPTLSTKPDTLHSNVGTALRKATGTTAILDSIMELVHPYPEETLVAALVATGYSSRHFGAIVPLGTEEF